MTFTRKIALAGALPVLLLSALPALAHHAMDGEMPSTFLQGFLSGLAHPILGLDHFAVLAAAGLVSAALGAPLLVPVAFVAAMIGGVGLHLALFDLPAVESLVALSLVIVGGIAALRLQMPKPVAAAVMALAGLVNGYALGESIVGAETTALGAYLFGLFVMHSAIVAGFALVARRLMASEPVGAPFAISAGGLAVALAGSVLWLGTLVGGA